MTEIQGRIQELILGGAFFILFVKWGTLKIVLKLYLVTRFHIPVSARAE